MSYALEESTLFLSEAWYIFSECVEETTATTIEDGDSNTNRSSKHDSQKSGVFNTIATKRGLKNQVAVHS